MSIGSVPRPRSGEIVAFGVGDIVVVADFRLHVCFPFILVKYALFHIIQELVYVCGCTRESIVGTMAKGFEKGGGSQ
jgi:hypothetical protein